MSLNTRPLGLSITIPVYRSGATIARALESVIEGFSKLGESEALATEILVVFDGPDEESLEITQQVATTTTLSIHCLHKDHSGIAATRNLGLGTARYSHVTFLDSDDEITPERFRVAAGYPDEIVIGRQKVVFDVASPPPGGVPDPRTTDGSPTPYLTSLVAPADTVLGIAGFRESIALSDDLDLVMRLRKHGASIRFDEGVFVVRHVTGNNASLDAGLRNKEFFRILRDSR